MIRTMLLIWLAVRACTAMQAQPCVYLAYEPFAYPSDMPLAGLSGGGGWYGSWQVQNDNTDVPGYQIASAAGSLTYNDLLVAGNHASGGRQYLTAWREVEASPEGTFTRYVAEGEYGIGTRMEGDTLWFSALMQVNADNDHEISLDLFGGYGFWCPECPRLSLGFFGPSSKVGAERRWSMRWGNNVMLTGTPVQTGVPVLAVTRLVFQPGGTHIALYLNPATLGDADALIPDITFTSPEPLVIRTLVLYMDVTPGSVAVDEIRFSDTYRCVAPDQNTPVDLPPVAAFSADPASGTPPLTVTFDASASFDPDGGALTYFWDFGDGSEAQSGGLIQQHTYTDLVGEISVTLRVRDASGQENSASRRITLYDAFGSFPCQTTVTCLQMASCQQDDGVLRLNTHGNDAAFTLRRAGGQEVPAVDFNHFRELPAGRYQLTVQGANGCRDTFPIHIRVDSTTCAGWQPDSCAMRIATNLEGFADWVPARPLRNLIKHIRSGLIPYTADCNCWSLDHILPEIMVDAQGYPLQIPQPTSAGPALVRFFLSAEHANIPPGTHAVIRYDGEGTLQLQGGLNVLSHQPGRIEFLSTGDMWMNLTASTGGNPVRNIRITRLDDEDADLESEPFYQGFLDKIAPFGALRFMDWGSTNNNPVERWEDRTRLDHFSYAHAEGVPYELMIQLCNQTMKDAWICVPHAADEHYIRQMARLFRDQLDPALTIYLEYSNEVWNWIFSQAHYNDTNRPSNLNYGRAYAEKAGRLFRLWHEEFGAEAHRFRRVLGIQAGFNYLNEQILAQLPPDAWDYGSPTHYVGLTHGAGGQPVLHAGSTPEDVLANARQTFLDHNAEVHQDYRNIQALGKEVVTYEGGQHFVGNVFGIPYDYQQAMWDAQYHPGIYNLYRDLHDTIRHWGCRMATNFSLASRQESVYGSWGVLNDIDLQPPFMNTAPKYQALLDMVCASDPVQVETPALPDPGTLRVWPNPGQGRFAIALSEGLEMARKTVHDISGRLVWAETSAATQLDLALPAGYYILTVWAGDRMFQEKLVVVE
jgi:hypothetical protein